MRRRRLARRGLGASDRWAFTSNKIYAALGFAPVADWLEIAFER